MAAICGECGDYFFNPYIGLSRFEKIDGKLVGKIGGWTSCYIHFYRIINELHNLDELPDGPVIRIDERFCKSDYLNGRIPWSVKDESKMVLGFLSLGETIRHFPNICSKYPTIIE